MYKKELINQTIYVIFYGIYIQGSPKINNVSKAPWVYMYSSCVQTYFDDRKYVDVTFVPLMFRK